MLFAVLAVITNTDDVRACALADGGALVGTSGGLVHGAAVITASDGLPGTRVDAIALAGDGKHAWIGTDGGVGELDLATDKVVRAVTTKPVRDLATFDGKLYVATWDGGVVKLGNTDPIPMRGGTAAARMRVSSLAIAGGKLYAGTAAGLYALAGGRFERVDGAPADIATLATGDRDTLYLGTPTGLVRRDGSFHQLGGGDIRRIAVVGEKLVTAGDAGLQVVDRDRVVALPGAPKLGLGLAIAGDEHRACAGGLDGLWLRDADADAWTRAPARGGLPSNDVSALAADGDTLWVGTFDHGLASYDGKAWRRIDNVDPRIDAIVVAPDAIWIGTAEGVDQLARDGHVLAHYTRRDGLPGRSALALARLRDGRIVVGSSSGAAIIDDHRVLRVGPRGGEAALGNVWAIAEADDGTLWLGATTGLYHGPALAWSAKDGGEVGAWERHSVASGELRDDWVTAIVATHDAVWAGTYNGGVTKIDGAGATQLGGGWINPAGLAWDGDHLLAATMDGLVRLDGTTWTAIRDLPGRDTTAVVRTRTTMWVATRRGIAAR